MLIQPWFLGLKEKINILFKVKNMQTAEEILKPYVEIPFRHTQIVEKDNAIEAMEQFADQFRDGINWIPCKEQTPPDYQRVIYFDSRDNGEIAIGYFVWSQTPVNYVTHWMPLPSTPK